MCRVSAYKSQTCNHRWFALLHPCATGMSFRTAPPGHPFDRPRTFLGATMWYPAQPGSCPDCDFQGRYDGDKVRLYLGKGGAGKTQGRRGMWGPYGNGFWGGGQGGNGYGEYGGWYGQQHGMGGGYTPGEVAVAGSGGYNWRGEYVGNSYGRRVQGGCLGCFGL